MQVEDYEEAFGVYCNKGWKDEYYKYRHEGGTMMFEEWFNWFEKQQEENEQTGKEITEQE